MEEIEISYIELLRGFSDLKLQTFASKDLMIKCHQALKQLELQLTAHQIIQCIYEAFETPKQFRRF